MCSFVALKNSDYFPGKIVRTLLLNSQNNLVSRHYYPHFVDEEMGSRSLSMYLLVR